MKPTLAAPTLLGLTFWLWGPMLAAQGGPAPRVTGTVPVTVVRASDGPQIDIPMPPRSVLNEIGQGKLPPIPVGTGTLPQPDSKPFTVGKVGGTQPQTGQLTFFRNRITEPAGASKGNPGEPDIAINRDTLFATGNTYGSLSRDSGMTWTHVNPYTLFPAQDGGVCCDQRVLYIPWIDCTVWYIQYRHSATTQRGGFRLAIANGRADLRDSTWATTYWNTQNFGYAPGHWFDFPDFAYSNGHLYMASNVFQRDALGNDTYRDSVVARMSLSTVRTGGGGPWLFYSSATHSLGGASYRFAQQSTATMYWATHITTTSMRVFRWIDSANSREPDTTLTIPQWNNAAGSAPGPDGREWIGSDDHRIASGYHTTSEVGFLFTSAQMPANGRARPFIRVVRVNPSTMALIGTNDVFNGEWAVAYPAVATNHSDHKGTVMCLGGGPQYHVTAGAMLVDNYAQTWDGNFILLMASGTHGSPSNRWGDYLGCAQAYQYFGQTFVGTGMMQNGGTTTANTQHRYVWFGRDDYTPPTINVAYQAATASGPLSGVPVTLDIDDLNSNRSGTTPFTRTYTAQQGLQVSAPGTRTLNNRTYVFESWSGNGTYYTRNVEYTSLGTTDKTLTANYEPGWRLDVQARPAIGPPITLNVADANGDQDGNANFARYYADFQNVYLTAPLTHAGRTFRRWIVNGLPHTDNVRTISVTLTQDATLVAEFGYFTPGSANYLGSNCGSLSHTLSYVSGTPEIGETLGFVLQGGDPLRAQPSAILQIGTSDTSWYGLPLPFDLALFGAPGCRIYTSSELLSLPLAVNAAGRAQFDFLLPNQIALIGVNIYSQFWVYKRVPNNSFGIVLSNYYRITLGGWRIQ